MTNNAKSQASAIEVANLRRSFGKIQAVRDVSFTIEQGEIVALLGSNGAGKTTTIDTILGFSAPTSGTVAVLGQRPRTAIARGEVAAVMQTGGLLADLTVAETVDVIAGLHRAKDRVQTVMETAQLTDIARRKISKCSGGEQQRVKFALALLPNPDVLILDEPTAGMDVVARRRFWKSMQHEASTGRTIVFATHYLEEAEQFAQRTIVMHGGQIVADAETSELRSSLGGYTLTITMRDDAQAREIQARLADDETVNGIERDGASLTLRSHDTDRIAADLLGAGGHDLEVAAPTLENAFTALTEEAAA